MKINQIFTLLFLLFVNVINESLDHCVNWHWYFEDYCDYCDDGYKLKEEDGSCSACESGKTGYNNYCFSTIENCEEYELYFEGEICIKCKGGYGLSEDSKKCTKCNDEEISNGYSKCNKKIEHCNEYHSDFSCERCENNYYLKGNKCISCEANQRSYGRVCFDKIENCESYYYDGYPLYDSEDDCIQYSTDKPNLTTGGTQCNTCTSGQYFYNNECIDEIKYCMEYSSKTECSRCKIGYQIKEGKCVPCVNPYLSKSDGKKCYLKHAFCEDHDYEGNCIYCYEGYSINSSKGCSKKNAGGLNIYNSFNIKIILAVLFFIL
jgi:hypothetical protein